MKNYKNRYKNDSWEIPLPELENKAILAFCFAAPEYMNNPKPFDDLKAKYPEIEIIGCSTSGEILEDEITDNTVVINLIVFDNSNFRISHANLDDNQNSYSVGKYLATQLNNPELKGITVLSDGLNINGTELVNGLNENLDTDVTVSGGLAGDGQNFDQTWVLVDGKPRTNYVSAVGFYGENISITCQSEGGWQPFGPERLVTKSENNILYTLDNRPALSLYKQYLGERANDLPASALLFPLLIESSKDSLVRTILAIDEETQSMTFAGDIPQGSIAKLMRSSNDSLINGAEIAAQEVNKNISNNECLQIAISCVGRRIVLGENSGEEIEATKNISNKNTTQIGFYSYGEIAPTSFQSCGLHNQTMTVTKIYES